MAMQLILHKTDDCLNIVFVFFSDWCANLHDDPYAPMLILLAK